jgi:diaminopimelate decarboxylase
MSEVWTNVADHDLLKLVQKARTPAYIYNLTDLGERIRQVQEVFPHRGFSLLFATMANPMPEILSFMARNGVGACVNSIAHLRAALEQGIPPQQIQFTSTGMSVADMQDLLTLGVAVNLDSVSQLREWFAAGGTGGRAR